MKRGEVGPEAAGGREVRLEAAFNVRDLGGLPVGPDAKSMTAPGLIYRGDSLDLLTAADEKILFDQLAIGAILDLRTSEEAGRRVLRDDKHFPHLRTQLFPLIPDGRLGIEPFPVGDPEAVAGLYLKYITERAAIAASAVDVIVESVSAGIPVLFHCAAGRDRTGAFAAVILGLLDVPDDEIVRDYTASNIRAREVSERLAGNPLYRADQATFSKDVNLVDPLAMEEFLRLVRVTFGGFREWSADAGVATSSLDRLVKTMIVDR